MARAKKIAICALRGKTRPVTREHVPPKNLFLPPRPPNTLTMPVCGPCNHGYHLDDEYFRVFLALQAEPNTPLWRLWKEKVVGSSFARSGGLKGRLSDDRGILLRHPQAKPLRTPDGEFVGDEALRLLQPMDASRVNAVVEKIVRCLHFACTATVLSPRATVTSAVANLQDDAEMRLLYDEGTGEVGQHDEFVFRREAPNTHESRWLLVFYRQCIFDVHVSTS